MLEFSERAGFVPKEKLMVWSFRERVGAHAIRVSIAVMIVGVVAPGIQPVGVSAAGNAFYVNCSTGKDTNPGTAAAPWKSLTKASAATLGAGDQLLLARGCVWDGQRLDAPWNGTAAAPITIGAYGDGARPIIKNGANSNVKVTGSFITVDGLESANDPRSRDACGQPLGTYYGFNFNRLRLGHGYLFSPVRLKFASVIWNVAFYGLFGGLTSDREQENPQVPYFILVLVLEFR